VKMNATANTIGRAALNPDVSENTASPSKEDYPEQPRKLSDKLYLVAKNSKTRSTYSNAQERRLSESRMRENLTYGLMRGGW